MLSPYGLDCHDPSASSLQRCSAVLATARRPQILLASRRCTYQLRKGPTQIAALHSTETTLLPRPFQRGGGQDVYSWGRGSMSRDLGFRGENYHYCRTLANAARDSENEIASISRLELGSNKISPEKKSSYDGIFLILLLNIGIFVADFWLGISGIRMLYLYHEAPQWYQFVTSTFCHLSWNHLSSNLFFLYIFGKLVEDEGGAFAVWLSYLVTGVGANLVSYLILPRTIVSAGASGAVFGLFAVSVFVKLSFDWRKILEVMILGQFVVERVMEAAQASALQGGRAYNSSMNINHIAHLSGALLGAALILVLKRLPSGDPAKK